MDKSLRQLHFGATLYKLTTFNETIFDFSVICVYAVIIYHYMHNGYKLQLFKHYVRKLDLHLFACLDAEETTDYKKNAGRAIVIIIRFALAIGCCSNATVTLYTRTFSIGL